jgi:predicted DNA-binding transcriptional regulator AlpA
MSETPETVVAGEAVDAVDAVDSAVGGRFEPLWKIGDVAAFLSVSAKTVEKMRSEGGLTGAIVFGRNVRWVPEDVREWALSRREQYDAGEQWAV